MPAYVPPALRGVAGQQADGKPRLGDRIWRVTLEYTAGGPFDVTECPETLIESADCDQPADVTVRHFELPSEASTTELRELLNWFSKASAAASEQQPQGDARCQLLFPPTLSKDARKHIHQLAQTLRLPTFSKGLGDDRRLMVHGVAFRDTPEMEAEVAAVAARRRAPAAIRERAKQIWKWCQADGGALWSLSLGELEESLLSAPNETALPPAVKDLLERREHGTALIAAIRAGDTPAALAVLEAHPRAAWIRDDAPATTPPTPPPPPPAPPAAAAAPAAAGAAAPAAAAAGPSAAGAGSSAGGGGGASASAGPGAEGPGYYPLHLAALAGMGEVVDKISAQPGAVEQRDRNYATPLKVAKKAGQAAMVDILLRHGAKDYEVNQAAHKTAAMGIPTPPARGGASGRRVSSSHGGSPHVGSPANASSPHASGSLGSSYMAAHAAARQRRLSSDTGRGPHSLPNPQLHHQGQQHGQANHHGPSGLGAGQQGQQGHHRGGGGSGRRSLDEHHNREHHNRDHHNRDHHHQGQGHGQGNQQQHHHHHPPPPPPPPTNDPTLNPFAVLAGEARSGASSRRSSAGGLPPRPPSEGSAAAGGGGGTAGAGSDSDSSAGGGGGNRVGAGGRTRAGGNSRCQLPPIQSGEVSEENVMAALTAMGLSAKPGLPTAPEAPEEIGGAAAAEAAGSDDDEEDDGGGAAGGGAGGEDAPKKRKTRRGRRGRGSRRHSSATTDEVMSAAVAAAASAAAVDPTAPLPPVQPHHRAVGGPASIGADSSDRSGLTDGSESDGSASGSKTRRGGQPARARRHERRRAARVSGADGGGDRPSGGAGGGRRGSGAEYASFHQGHAGGTGRGGAGAGGHYHVYGSAHHGHADDATSWRRDPAAAPPAGPTPIAVAAAVAAATTSASPSPLRGGHDEPRQPASAGGRPPAARRMSGPGVPVAAPGAAAAGGGTTSSSGALPEAPGSPFHYGGAHGSREHVAAGPTTGVGFGFGRGRGRGLPPSAPGAPSQGGGVPSAPGSPLRPPVASNGSQPHVRTAVPPPPPPAAAGGSAGAGNP
ncbi:hypothetical protein PLESTB_001814300 [Pleodorina starrii]|uniref:R3H domain-containing protein n=1 Tax=Pleodorina starrii TaxID=330485 RepID=A0A9W6C0X9_9CHLO|nr:hypothetical protein PLESTB_001814300 [Pleodorina starrii]